MSGEKTTERVRFLREAGVVMRHHAFGCPDPAQTVALHSWGALNLLLVLHPDPSLDLIKAVQWHDAPERFTGDIAAPAKWASPKLADALEELETRIHAYFGTAVSLTPDEAIWLVAVDLLDLLLMAQERRSLGDYRFTCMVGKVSAWFASNKVPVQVARFLESYVHGTRLLDMIPGERNG